MRVSALETPAVVSEQQAAWIKQPVTGVRAIGEAAFDDGRNAEALVPLREGPIGRSGATHDFVHAPALSSREHPLGGRGVRPRGRTGADGLGLDRHGSKIAIFPKRRNIERGYIQGNRVKEVRDKGEKC